MKASKKPRKSHEKNTETAQTLFFQADEGHEKALKKASQVTSSLLKHEYSLLGSAVPLQVCFLIRSACVRCKLVPLVAHMVLQQIGLPVPKPRTCATTGLNNEDSLQHPPPPQFTAPSRASMPVTGLWATLEGPMVWLTSSFYQ